MGREEVVAKLVLLLHYRESTMGAFKAKVSGHKGGGPHNWLDGRPMFEGSYNFLGKYLTSFGLAPIYLAMSFFVFVWRGVETLKIDLILDQTISIKAYTYSNIQLLYLKVPNQRVDHSFVADKRRRSDICFCVFERSCYLKCGYALVYLD